MAGPVWPGCILPKVEDVVEVDVESIDIEADNFDLPGLSQLTRELGLVLSGNPTPKEVLRTLRAAELDESNARGRKGTR